MKRLLTIILLTLTVCAKAQIGIGTTTPNSTLDVRGALSLNFRVFTGISTPISSTDNTVIFTGTLASTATLPDATTCIGRIYRIQNASITIPEPILTIATTAAQTIDGAASWVLDETYESITIISNGANWLISSQSLPNSSGSAWIQGGNNVTALKNLGTVSNYDLPFITNNTEKMRLTASGNLGIGTSAFDPIYPEKLLVNAGVTSSFNLIEGHGKINSYLQFNIQNDSSGSVSSSDMIATSNNGNEVKYYVDLGINSSGNTQNFFGGANDAYLYSQGDTTVANTLGGNLYIGTSLPSRDIAFLTGGGTKSSGVTMNNERLRILSTGNVGINTNTPTEKLDVTGNLKFSGALMPGGSAGTAGFILQSMGAGTAPVWFDASGFAWLLDGNTVVEVETIGTKNAFDLGFITNNTERMRIDINGNVGIGTTSPTAALHLKAGTATASTAPLKFTSGTKLTTPEAGATEFDGVNTYITNETTSGRGAIPVEQHFLLSATGTAISTIGNYFGTTSNISLVSGGYYEIEIDCYFLKTTAGAVTWTFTNSAAPTAMNLYYDFSPATGIVSAPAATDLIGDQYDLTTAVSTAVSASLTTGVNHHAHFKIILLNGTGTSLKIQATCGAGTITPGTGSRWYCKRISTSNVGTFAN
jgi:hypothetical protein